MPQITATPKIAPLHASYIQHAYVNTFITNFPTISSLRSLNDESICVFYFFTVQKYYNHEYLFGLSGTYRLKTVCRGSFDFLLENEGIGLVRFKTSRK
jgi:hypothetical protein